MMENRIFKIKDVEKYWVEIYEIEALNEQLALNKYINELAGSLNPVNYYYDPNEKDTIEVLCEFKQRYEKPTNR